ncbi:MAG: SPOR domain-containing protein [Magnetococcus sp. DMHC-8]
MLTFLRKNQWITLLAVFFLIPAWPLPTPLMAAEGAAETSERTSGSTSHHFTLLVEPTHAKVEILNLKEPYQPNMLLKPGRYHIAVSAPGHETEKGFIDVTDQDWVGKVVLLPIHAAPQKEDVEGTGTARLDEEWRKLKQEQESLDKARIALAQERDKLNQSRKELETASQALELAKKEWEEKRLVCPSQPESKPVADSRPAPEAKPMVNETKPMVNETKPMVNETRPVPETKSMVNETRPVPETKPMVNETRPVPETRPMVNETRPVPETRPMVNETRPVPETKPIAETGPVPETRPVTEAKPADETPPVVETRTVVNAKPVAEPKPAADKSVATGRHELPIPTPPPQVVTRNKVTEEADLPAKEPAVPDNDRSSGVADSGTATPPPVAPVQEVTTVANDTVEVAQPGAATVEVAQPGAATVEVARPGAAGGSKEQAALLLAEAERYLKLPRPPNSDPPPEGQEALRQLRQAQQWDPTSKAIAQALNLYDRRHITYTHLFENKEKADGMVERIQALGIPAFQQAMVVKGKPAMRICIGPFLTQEEAASNLQRLRESMEIRDAIQRVYKQ